MMPPHAEGTPTVADDASVEPLPMAVHCGNTSLSRSANLLAIPP
jgi:hypothetical protein